MFSKLKPYSELFEVAIIGGAVLALAFIFAGEPLRISGNSMYPYLHDGEKIIAEKISLRNTTPERGEILVFKAPDQGDRYFIKRVVGLPGETITIKDGKVFINNEPLSEPYLDGSIVTLGDDQIQEGSDYKIPENSYVLMGDNRGQSVDSRSWGAIKDNMIIGRGFLIYSPIKDFRKIT